MEKRRFGRSEHESSMAIFGACALGFVTQKEADNAMQGVIDAGITHIDIAPTYGNAEDRIAHWIPEIRDQFFLGCKTMERSKKGAARAIRESLDRLRTDHFDLYQMHAITNMDELDEVTMTGGALEAIIDARDEGLTKHIGITGHGIDTPAVFIEALKRFNLDSVLFPVNFVLYANPKYRESAEKLIALCQQKDVGMMGIKHITRGPWGEKAKTHNTWYEPFIEKEMIKKAVDFALSQGITGICTPCDVKIMPDVIMACEHFYPMSKCEQEKLIASAPSYTPLFT
jgi:aryl-alcohol dehydrogenase-like predicted oxidoreductase